MSKRAQSLYQPGKRGGAWVKVKTRGRQEFVIAGYTLGKGRRSKGIGALILAVERDGELVHVGNCGTGFDDKELDRLQGLLDPLRRDTCPLGGCAAHAAGAHDRCDLGRAKARVRGRVRGVDVRRPAARTGLHGPSRRQARERGAPRAAGAEGPPRPAGLEPRQGVLARRGHHEGRPDRVLPRGGRRARAAPAGPALHDEALPRRDRRRPLLPEGRAQAHARLDPHAPVPGDVARATAASGRSAIRSSTSRPRSSGWPTWAAST